MKRKLRMGMVGGGKDAFIGAIHRFAANLDGLIELSCGALSINPEIAKDSAKDLGIKIVGSERNFAKSFPVTPTKFGHCHRKSETGLSSFPIYVRRKRCG